MTDVNSLSRAELAALVAETLAAKGINVVLVGGSCVCVYTNERFGSFDLDFVDLSYSRKRKIANVEIGDRPLIHKLWPDGPRLSHKLRSVPDLPPIYRFIYLVSKGATDCYQSSLIVLNTCCRREPGTPSVSAICCHPLKAFTVLSRIIFSRPRGNPA